MASKPGDGGGEAQGKSTATRMARQPKKRLSLMERQQKLLEEHGFSKPKGQPQSRGKQIRGTRQHYSGSQKAFFSRQDKHLNRQSGGLSNATASSRRRASIPTLLTDDGDDGSASVLDQDHRQV